MNFNNFNTTWFVALTITILLLAVAHWFPWPWWNGRKLPRLVAYSLGCGCLLTGIIIYLSSVNTSLILPVALLFILPGIAVFICWALDRFAVAINKGRNERSSKEK
jgi:hypothetical protein